MASGFRERSCVKNNSQLHIAYSFYDRPNYTAGPKINALRLLPELQRRGYQVTAIVGYFGECPSQALLESQGVDVIAIPWTRFCEDQMNLLQDALLECDPDIYVPNISVSGCYAARFLREAGRPTVAGHLSDDEFNWGMAERFCRDSDHWAVSGLFCMGSELGDIVRGWNPQRTKVVDICHGVPTPQQQADVRGPLRLVYSGRFEERQKRIMDVAIAIGKVLRRYPDAQARMIGDGSRLQDVKNFFAEQGIADRVHLLGYVDPAQVQDEMRWGNVFVLLSDYEGVPGAVMDAMAVGLVPVCLDIEGGLRELVVHEETGLLVDDRDSSFDKAIDRLSEDETFRGQLARKGRQHVESHFSLKVAADKWESLFESLMAEAGPRKSIRFPRRPHLPPLYPKLAHEDVRRPIQRPVGLGARLRTFIPHPAKRIVRRIRGSAGDSTS